MTIKASKRTYKNGKSYWRVAIHLAHTCGTRERREFNRPADWSYTRVIKWAQQREAHLLTDGPQNKEVKAKNSTMTFLEFVARFIVDYPKIRGVRESTMHRYRDHIVRVFGPMFGDKNLETIGDAEFRALAGLGDLAPGSRNILIAELLCMLRVAIEWGYRSAPVPKVRRVRESESEPHWYSLAEYNNMIAAAPSGEHMVIVLLGGDAGLRSGEMLALRVGNIDRVANEIVVAHSMWKGKIGPPKGGKTRRVPISPRLLEAIDEVCHGAPSDAFVLTGTTEPLTRSQLKHRARVVEGRALGTVAKAQPGRVHVYRHTFCSLLVRRGVHPRTVQKLAGHSSLRQTERYMNVSDAMLHEAIRTLDPGDAADTRRPEPPDEKD